MKRLMATEAMTKQPKRPERDSRKAEKKRRVLLGPAFFDHRHHAVRAVTAAKERFAGNTRGRTNRCVFRYCSCPKMRRGACVRKDSNRGVRRKLLNIMLKEQYL